MMGKPAMGRRWDIEKEAACFNCHKGATQLIEISPTEAIITCTNCMAERHYTLHKIDIPEDRKPFESEEFKRRYEIWNFKYVDSCPNCGNCVENEVNVDEFRVRTVCPACYYTRVYDFNMYSESHARR